jgi:hypothetical protein
MAEGSLEQKDNKIDVFSTSEINISRKTPFYSSFET